MKYWLGVVSREHVMRAVSLGMAQIGHGKREPLARMKAGDGFVYYSPKESLGGSEPLKAFTAIGKITDDEIWQVDEGDFKPWQRRLTYVKSTEAPIRPLLDQLTFTSGRTNWGYMFRYGLFEISEADFKTIAKAMHAKV
ncbi:MAG: EVE domain-containing protein [Thermoleophilia bacterium]